MRLSHRGTAAAVAFFVVVQSIIHFVFSLANYSRVERVFDVTPSVRPCEGASVMASGSASGSSVSRKKAEADLNSFWELPDMMPAKFSEFSACPHLDLIYAIKFMQPPLLRPLLHDSPPPP